MFVYMYMHAYIYRFVCVCVRIHAYGANNAAPPEPTAVRYGKSFQTIQ